MSVFNIPAQDRAPGSYGPFGPVSLGTDNSVSIDFVSSDWMTPGGQFTLHVDRLPGGAGNWILDDFRGVGTTGSVNEKTGQPLLPVVRDLIVPPGDQVRVRYDVAGRTINLGATVTTAPKA